MDETELKFVLEAALLAAGRPLSLDQLVELLGKRVNVDPDAVRNALAALMVDYEGRGIEIKEVASGYRIQIRRSMTDWLMPLWEERPPRYSRALLETLALIAYRQPITRGEIEDIRGVAVGTNIVRTLLERGWVRVVGHRDVPGKPSMFGTTRDFLDYFGLKRLEELPPLSDLKDFSDPNPDLQFPELHPQSDIVEILAGRESLDPAQQDTAEAADDGLDVGNPEEIEIENVRAKFDELDHSEHSGFDVSADQDLDSDSTIQSSEENDLAPESEVESESAAVEDISSSPESDAELSVRETAERH